MTCIAVDFDGTLARDDGFKGISVCGEPIVEMVERVKRWIDEGHEVWIYTARLSNEHGDYEHAYYFLELWCKKHLGFILPMTATKHGRFDVFFDDRAVAVEKNCGTCAVANRDHTRLLA